MWKEGCAARGVLPAGYPNGASGEGELCVKTCVMIERTFFRSFRVTWRTDATHGNAEATIGIGSWERRGVIGRDCWGEC